jgi:hypothetical protein
MLGPLGQLTSVDKRVLRAKLGAKPSLILDNGYENLQLQSRSGARRSRRRQCGVVRLLAGA